MWSTGRVQRENRRESESSCSWKLGVCAQVFVVVPLKWLWLKLTSSRNTTWHIHLYLYIHMYARDVYVCVLLVSGLKSAIFVWFIYGSCVSFPNSPKQTEALINFIAGVDRQVRAHSHSHTLELTRTLVHSLTHTLTRTLGVCAMSLTYEPTAWMFVFAKHFLTLLFSGCCFCCCCCFWLPARF